MSASTPGKSGAPVANRGDAERCAVRGFALGVFDRGPAAHGWDPLDELRYTKAKTAGDW
jgi:hypothetical protein